MLVFVVVVAISIAVLYWLLVRSRQVDLTGGLPPDKKPEWLATTPPRETIAATQADGEGITLFDADPGERLAAPFAEQIEDIANALLAEDPQLAGTKIDFGTAPDGSLEIWVGDKRYTDIAHLPDEHLRAVMQQAVARYNEHHAK
jgi:hypothetical protein